MFLNCNRDFRFRERYGEEEEETDEDDKYEEYDDEYDETLSEDGGPIIENSLVSESLKSMGMVTRAKIGRENQQSNTLNSTFEGKEDLASGKKRNKRTKKKKRKKRH